MILEKSIWVRCNISSMFNVVADERRRFACSRSLVSEVGGGMRVLRLYSGRIALPPKGIVVDEEFGAQNTSCHGTHCSFLLPLATNGDVPQARNTRSSFLAECILYDRFGGLFSAVPRTWLCHYKCICVVSRVKNPKDALIRLGRVKTFIVIADNFGTKRSCVIRAFWRC